MERKFLSGRSANGEDVAVLRRTLSTTEINYTFHRIPAPKTIENWKTLTPDKFRFALKAPQKSPIGRS